MRKWREIHSLLFHIFSLFPLSLSISYINNCLILSQNVKYGTFVANVTKTLTYLLWENSSGSNPLRESCANCEGLLRTFQGKRLFFLFWAEPLPYLELFSWNHWKKSPCTIWAKSMDLESESLIFCKVNKIIWKNPHWIVDIVHPCSCYTHFILFKCPTCSTFPDQVWNLCASSIPRLAP